MRVRKAHFISFLNNYKGDKTSVAEIQTAYNKALMESDKRNLVTSTRRRNVPVGIVTGTEETTKEAKYTTRRVEVSRVTGATYKWVELQLRKLNTVPQT